MLMTVPMQIDDRPPEPQSPQRKGSLQEQAVPDFPEVQGLGNPYHSYRSVMTEDKEDESMLQKVSTSSMVEEN